MRGYLDNKKNGKVGDTLKDNTHKDSRLSIISALFSIYGFDVLKKELSQVKQVRLLFSKIETTNEHHHPRTAQIIQRTIPYPVLLIFNHNNHIALSAADKLINQVDQQLKNKL